MKRKPEKFAPTLHGEDGPEWTVEQLERAELAEGGKVLRPAAGTLTQGRGRPKVDNPKA